MGEEDEKTIPLLQSSAAETRPPIQRTGTLWSAVAHIITGVIGSGVLSLAWSLAQLGWIAGPIAMLIFAFITLLSAFLLCNCYRSPDPEQGPLRNDSYLHAVHFYLGEKRAWLCGFFVHINLYGIGIAYTITSAISMRAIQESNCYHSQGHQAACKFEDAYYYMLLFGFVQMLMSQIPNMHDIKWVSLVAAIMSCTYSLIVLALGIARVIENGSIQGTISGTPTSTVMEKVWLVAQGLGDIAFAYPYSLILIEIQDTLKSPPSENETMKKASTLSLATTTIFYLLCGGFGYAAFGVDTPGNLMTGLYEPYWLIDLANACIVLHLVGGYQVFSQPLFAAVDRWFSQKFPDNEFVHKSYTLKLPLVSSFSLRVNSFRLCSRTFYVASTTILGIVFPYFNQVLGILGALIFWPLSIYFPVEMYLMQRNIQACTCLWIALRTFTYVCLVVTIFALSGSVAGLITAKLG